MKYFAGVQWNAVITVSNGPLKFGFTNGMTVLKGQPHQDLVILGDPVNELV